MFRIKNILVPFLTSLTFSGSFVAAKYTTADLTPLATTFLRYMIATVFFAVLVVIKKTPVTSVKRWHLLPLLVAGLFGIVGYHCLFFASLHHTSVTNTAIINGLSPAVTGLLAALFIAERLSRLNWLGIAIAFVGVLMLVSNGDIDQIIQFEFNTGDLLMLTAVFCWAVYALIIKRMVEQYSTLTVTFLSALFAVGAMLLLLVFEDLSGQLRAISVSSIMALLYMGLAASGIGYLLYNMSIKQIGPTRTSGVVYSAVPVLTAGLAFLFFTEPLTASALISTALIILGLHLALRAPVSQRKGLQHSGSPD